VPEQGCGCALGVDCGVGASRTYICFLTIRRFSSIVHTHLV
jgi:hypothetical protein